MKKIIIEYYGIISEKYAEVYNILVELKNKEYEAENTEKENGQGDEQDKGIDEQISEFDTAPYYKRMEQLLEEIETLEKKMDNQLDYKVKNRTKNTKIVPLL